MGSSVGSNVCGIKVVIVRELLLEEGTVGVGGLGGSLVGSSVGSDVGGGIKVEEGTGMQLWIPRRWQYSAMAAADGRSKPGGREPSARITAMREERER